MPNLALHCDDPTRRRKLREQEALNGLDYLEVSDDQLTLTLFFIGRAPEWLKKEHIRISGGRRVRDIRVLEVDICQAETDDRDDCVKILVDKPGDFSCYTLCIVAPDERSRSTQERHPEFDPRYACLEFTFKANCPTDLDCLPVPCPPEVLEGLDINYLAKDYASFRQLIFDRLALLVPDWQERHVPDLGVALVEVLAYVGDHLSYYQDAVATEAYLDTARQRISVRRHTRLVDYVMHEGCNARTWLHLRLEGKAQQKVRFGDLEPNGDDNLILKGFITDISALLTTEKTLLSQDDLRPIPADAYVWFEAAVEQAELYQAHNDIHFYTWGDELCCLPTGSTSATLVDGEAVSEPPPDSPEQTSPKASKDNGDDGSPDDPCHGAARVLKLNVGDVLIFEEILGPKTGDPADADPTHRHAVKLTKVTQSCDPLCRQPVLEVEWAKEDTLPFALCLSSDTEACERIYDVSLAHGNIVLVDHGRNLPPEYVGEVPGVESTICDPCGPETERTSGRFRPSLNARPLTFRTAPKADQPASKMLVQDPGGAMPTLHPLLSSPLTFPEGTSDEAKAAQMIEAGGLEWIPVYDLIASGPNDAHVVAEMDDDGYAHLRFGDGELGRQPEPGHAFAACYRVGNGRRGNVGADSIRHIVIDSGLSGVNLSLRNPLAATGGTDPAPVAEVKRFAPFAFREDLQRAVTPQDYAVLAERDFDPLVQRAAGDLRWTGSWYELRLAVDAEGTPDADVGLLQRIEVGLERYRRIGHDLRVVAAVYVPLEVTLEVCVHPHYQKGHVKAALLERLGNRTLANGTTGFFHPDTLTFGEGVFLSRLVAEAKAVPGVENVIVRRLQRFAEPDDTPLATGLLGLTPFEVARLDNDPSFPENGVLNLNMRGGR